MEAPQERTNAALEHLQRQQNAQEAARSTPIPTTLSRQYPFLRPTGLLPFEDHRLIDATLEGKSYYTISQHLSTGSLTWTVGQCHDRIFNLKAKSKILPQSWEDPEIHIPRWSTLVDGRLVEGTYADTLLPHEYAEVALYVDAGRRLYTPFIFRSQISAVLLRACVRDIKEAGRLRPEEFRARVDAFHAGTAQRRREAEGFWYRRIVLAQGWGFNTSLR